MRKTIGLVGIVAGLVGVGYVLGTRSKMNKISDILNCSTTDVQAVEKASENESKMAVESKHPIIMDDDLKGFINEASKIDTERVRAYVENVAK